MEKQQYIHATRVVIGLTELPELSQALYGPLVSQTGLHTLLKWMLYLDLLKVHLQIQ